MEVGQLLGLVAVLGLPCLFLIYIARRFFTLKEKQLEVDARLAAEKAAQYAASNTELEQRVRVLEQIVTDRGMETASQIEALRSPRLTRGDKVS
jgi:hypothetical protein